MKCIHGNEVTAVIKSNEPYTLDAGIRLIQPDPRNYEVVYIEVKGCEKCAVIKVEIQIK